MEAGESIPRKEAGMTRRDTYTVGVLSVGGWVGCWGGVLGLGLDWTG